jgi:tRNA-specific 2-thiouridylase
VLKQRQRVVLAMSGGVDSSVAAHLLAQKGYEVVGVFMRHGGEPEPTHTTSEGLLPIVTPSHKQGCCSASDAEDARRIADGLAIPFYALNLKEDFDRIIDYFVEDYTSGRTPNPCVMCNNLLKFGKLFEYADSVDAEFVATGHYAQMHADESNGLSIHRGVDLDKDQSYVLFGVDKKYLPRMMLPIGGYQKSEIRAMAENFGLRVASKPDSQEICFVAAGQHADFVANRSDRKTHGAIVTTDGTVVAQHNGIERFTIGQRKGLGVAMGEPFFVVNIDAESNRVVIGKKEDLARSRLVASGVNWQTPKRSEPFSCLAQIRYNSRAEPATATPLENGTLQVDFDEPCHGVAPGQAVVCYDADRVLVGGWIRESS